MLATPEPRGLNLDKDKIKLRVVNSVKTLIKEFYNTHTTVPQPDLAQRWRLCCRRP